MIQLSDYLYEGDTVLGIISKYARDLSENAAKTGNEADHMHAEYLLHLKDLLENNGFLTDQSHRIHTFYQQMTVDYPYLAFVFKGRIKSLIRAEEKFNGYIVSAFLEEYQKSGRLPEMDAVRQSISRIKDMIAYRIVISLPRCREVIAEARGKEEIRLLYEIAEKLPAAMQRHGFQPVAVSTDNSRSPLSADVLPYYKDYVAQPTSAGYQSLHVTFFDTVANCHVEIQLRTKDMDDMAEIGSANHFGYEQQQNAKRSDRATLPQGLSDIFDEALARSIALQKLSLAALDVNMFRAMDRYLVNDCCGLLRGRLILPFEHLSRFQND